MKKSRLIADFIMLAVFTAAYGQAHKYSRRPTSTANIEKRFREDVLPEAISQFQGPDKNPNVLQRVIRSPHEEKLDRSDFSIDVIADHDGENGDCDEKGMESFTEKIQDLETKASSKIPAKITTETAAPTKSINENSNATRDPGQFLLPPGYNKLIIPRLECKTKADDQEFGEFCNTFPVVLHMEIIRIQDINEELEILTLDLDLRLRWVDGFVKDHHTNSDYHLLILDPVFLEQIWIPDIFIDKMAHVKRTSMLNKPLKVEFSPASGYISYKTRLRVQLGCDMTYEHYPADTQRCEFNIRSYSHTSDDLHLKWLDQGVYLRDTKDTNFNIQVSTTDEGRLQIQGWDDQTHYFNLLKFTILVRRKISFHMVQTYLPSIFFIAITWLCFLVPPDMVEARIGISMTTLLTLTSMFDSVREHSPHVSYVKAIDIWMVSCIFFIFMTLLMVVWLRHRRNDMEEQRSKRQSQQQETQHDTGYRHSLSQLEVTYLRRCDRVAEFTEKYAFLIFSAGFVVFNVVYWSWLLTASNYFGWKMNSTLNHLEGSS